MIQYSYSVMASDYLNAGKISSQIKSICKELNIPSDILKRIAIACYEAEINMVIHSYGGIIEFEVNPDDNQLSISFKDTGPGITDINQAMVAGYSTASDKAREFGFGAGMGLPNIKKMSDEFELTSSQEGTNLIVRFKL